MEEDFVNDHESEGEEHDLGDEGPPTIDPYEVLGLEPQATADDVKKAYRKMALKCHPGTPRHQIFGSSLTDSYRQGCVR